MYHTILALLAIQLAPVVLRAQELEWKYTSEGTEAFIALSRYTAMDSAAFTSCRLTAQMASMGVENSSVSKCIADFEKEQSAERARAREAVKLSPSAQAKIDEYDEWIRAAFQKLRVDGRRTWTQVEPETATLADEIGDRGDQLEKDVDQLLSKAAADRSDAERSATPAFVRDEGAWRSELCDNGRLKALVADAQNDFMAMRTGPDGAQQWNSRISLGGFESCKVTIHEDGSATHNCKTPRFRNAQAGAGELVKLRSVMAKCLPDGQWKEHADEAAVNLIDVNSSVVVSATTFEFPGSDQQVLTISFAKMR